MITMSGKPCSGKSTISKILKKDYGFENDYSDPDITSLKTLDGGVNIYAILTY